MPLVRGEANFGTENATKRSMWSVYIIECRDAKLYTGITTDVVRRLKEHNTGHGGRFTKYRKPIRLVYKEAQLDKSSALKREFEIKKMKRREKLRLIRTSKP